MSTPTPAADRSFWRRTGSELLYALVGLFQGILGFTFTVVTVVLSAGLLVTFLGLPLLAASGVASRWLGSGIRQGANRLLGTTVPAPRPFTAGPGVLGFVQAGLRDGAAWRSRIYLVLKLPFGIVSFTVAAVFWVGGLGGISYAAWRPFLPCNSDENQVCHRAAAFGPHYYLDSPGRVALMTLIGVVLLILAPWAVRGVLGVDRLAVRLLGPTRRDARVVELERSRAAAVDDSAAALRRIERDLHDGAQARLVALAMNVGLAREKLAEGGDPADAQRLLDTAHASAKEAIVELRDLARGIHPPVLDTGLDAALATLAAHSSVPVALDVEIGPRPDPAIETMAYFCLAELLTNVAKHSGATQARVEVRATRGRLVARVSDDGHGGARIGAGTGLTGLAERVSTVDGRLAVESPEGGPTTVTVDLPVRRADP